MTEGELKDRILQVIGFMDEVPINDVYDQIVSIASRLSREKFQSIVDTLEKDGYVKMYRSGLLFVESTGAYPVVLALTDKGKVWVYDDKKSFAAIEQEPHRKQQEEKKTQDWNKYEGYLVNLAVALVSAFATTIFQEDLKPQLIKQNGRIDSLRDRVDFLERHRTIPDSNYGKPISPVETRTIRKESRKDSLKIEGMSKSNRCRKVNNK